MTRILTDAELERDELESLAALTLSTATQADWVRFQELVKQQVEWMTEGKGETSNGRYTDTRS